MNSKNPTSKVDDGDEDCHCYAERRARQACLPLRNVTHPLRYYEFTREEVKALEDCDRESFYRRCLPLSAALAAAALAAVRSGYLRPNPRFGPYPKVTLAVVVGYFLGKLSYQQACAEKLMALPDSYIGQLLRERKEGRTGGGGRSAVAPPSMFGAGPGDIYSDAGPGSALNLDTDRPLFNDDSFSSTSGTMPQDGTGPAEPPRTSLSYDELRRRNRADLARADPYRTVPGPGAPAAPAAPPFAPPHPPTNKYGDSME